jgi:dipicolinate synthase subunit B
MDKPLKGLDIGFAVTGSFCTIDATYNSLIKLVNMGANVTAIISSSINSLDTRFQSANEIKDKLIEITGNSIVTEIIEAEPIGGKELLDALVVAPCTGNTLAKVSCAITDTSVTMAIKATLRNGYPVILAISTNDGLSANAKNIGMLLNTKNVYFVPFYQDSPTRKPTSLVANNDLIYETLLEALKGKQLQPILDLNDK